MTDQQPAAATSPDDATASLTAAEISTLRDAVQWAGFYAQRDGVRAGGPSLSSIAEATAILERGGHAICHSRAVRSLIDDTLAIAMRRCA